MWSGLRKQGMWAKIYHVIWWDISQYRNVVFGFCKMCRKPVKLCTISENCVAIPYWSKKLWVTKSEKLLNFESPHDLFLQAELHIYLFIVFIIYLYAIWTLCMAVVFAARLATILALLMFDYVCVTIKICINLLSSVGNCLLSCRLLYLL